MLHISQFMVISSKILLIIFFMIIFNHPKAYRYSQAAYNIIQPSGPEKIACLKCSKVCKTSRTIEYFEFKKKAVI